MDEHHIDKAIVASIHGILYKNVHASNVKVACQTKPYPERLIPFSTLNPTYPAGEEDLRRCAGVSNHVVFASTRNIADIDWPILRVSN